MSPDIDAGIQKAKLVLAAFSSSLPTKKGLLENFFGSPPYIEEPAFKDTVSRIDIESYEERIRGITAEIDSINARMAKLTELDEQLQPWSGLSARLSSIVRMRYASVFPLVGSPAYIEAARRNWEKGSAGSDLEWLEIERSEKSVAGILFVALEKAGEAEEWIRAAGVERVELPDLDETPREALERLAAEINELLEKKASLEESLRAEAASNRYLVQAAFDEYSNLKKNTLVRRKIFYTRNVLVVRGWALERDREKLQNLLAQKIPGAEARFSPPAKGDNPPVKLENPAVLRPFQTLLEMFGLPMYFGIDPTWFIAIAMTLFYSICLGDAGYGAMQILISLWLVRKFKPAEGTRLFLRLFTEMGVATVIFGILTWSFFGMSPGYVHGGPKILGFLPLFSPTSDILTIIAVGAVVGAIFQLSSILIGFYASLKSGDLAAAFYDKLAWFVFLVGLIGWAPSWFMPGFPKAICMPSLCLFFIGGAVILLFAGRKSKSIPGRLMVGVISFYGILGYYGAVSFFGDVLSYLRVAILNLTGGFIAFVANVIGQLLMGSGSPIFVAVTVVIALLPMLLFHTLNLVLSMMGAFVHSLRLNYLESFSRYYGSGGKVFAPFKKEGQFHRFEQ